MREIFKTGFCLLNYEDSCHGENEYIYWKHFDCGGRGFVNEYAEVECEVCHHFRAEIENLVFICPSHTFYRVPDKRTPQETIWAFASNFLANIEPRNDYFVQKLRCNLEIRIGPEKISCQYINCP